MTLTHLAVMFGAVAFFPTACSSVPSPGRTEGPLRVDARAGRCSRIDGPVTRPIQNWTAQELVSKTGSGGIDYPTASMVPGESPGPARLSPHETPAVGLDSTLGGGLADAAPKSADGSRHGRTP
jgi:hypothetical protein